MNTRSSRRRCPVSLFVILAIAVVGLVGMAAGQGQQAGARDAAATASASRTQVVLLGTGTPNADPDRSGPAVAVVVGGRPLLVDFGPGVVRRAAAAFRKGIRALEVKNLRVAFATHLHSDHTAGYPDLIFTPAVLERNAPLDVFGPPGLSRMTRYLLEAYREDIAIRLNDLEPARPAGYQVRAHDIAPGIVYRDPDVTVTAFPVRHGAWSHAYGYLFASRDRKVVVAGDCTPSESVITACNGCDVLVHEVYSAVALAKREPEWQRYHRAYHTSSYDLGELARRARPRLLVLYHQLRWSATDDELVREVQSRYGGAVVSGRDLDVF